MKLILSSVIGALALPLSAAPLKIQLPEEKPSLKAGPGRDALMGSCLVCHSVDYISTQPPLDAAGWKKTVEKMQNVFGAPLLDSQIPDLVTYLAKNYGPPAKAQSLPEKH